MSTEARNPRSIGLDKMSAAEIVRLMNEEEMAVMQAMAEAEEDLGTAAEKAAEAFQKGGRIIYVGAGTSGRLAAQDAAEMPPTFGVDPERFTAVVAGGTGAQTNANESAEDDSHAAVEALNALRLTTNDVVIGLAASGRTPFVIAAVKHANQKGLWTCGISNNISAPLADEVDLSIILRTGPEVLSGSTRLKAGTAQKMALNRISTIAMVLSGKVIENLMVDVKAKNDKLKERCVRIVRDLSNATDSEAREALTANDWNIRTALQAIQSD
jgi:N-acetylmuramic acid 6-phosphate etherase